MLAIMSRMVFDIPFSRLFAPALPAVTPGANALRGDAITMRRFPVEMDMLVKQEICPLAPAVSTGTTTA